MKYIISVLPENSIIKLLFNITEKAECDYFAAFGFICNTSDLKSSSIKKVM